MRIKLNNFANIESVDYEMENNKVNFLFGISGAGKSSIVKSLLVSDKVGYVKAGKGLADCNIFITDQPFSDNNDIAIYDYDFMNSVLIIKEKVYDVYRILFADDGNIQTYKNDYTTTMGSLFVSQDKIRDLVNQISILEKNLSLKFTTKDDYYASCVVGKFQRTVLSKNSNTLAKKYSGKVAQWFADGKNMSEYASGKCPFCGRKLSNYRKNLIDSITSIDIKSYEKIKNILPQVPDLQIVEPKWDSVKSTNAFKRKLHDLLDIKEELIDILCAIDASNASNYNPNDVKKLRVAKKTKTLFPEIVAEVNNYNVQLHSLKITYNKLVSESNKVLKKNMTLLNTYLKRFNVPYTFINLATNNSNETSGYYLKHIDDVASNEDRTDWLSFGERNIIGLVLFVIINSHKKLIVIDDPAGSFDNYRRKAALDFVFEKKEADTTILVLSHDEVFIKIALYYAGKNRTKLLSNASLSITEKKYAKEMGKATFIESGENHNLVDISENDFGVYSDFIKQRLSECAAEINMQTAILIRMLFEQKRKTTGINSSVYGYLSAIIHQTDYDVIMNDLLKKGVTEDKVLSCIYLETNISFSRLSKTYLNDIQSFNYSDFEMLVLYREDLQGKKDTDLKSILNEINSIVHQSATYLTCLNPFKYKMYSFKTHAHLNSFKNDFLARK